jgi:hypothetical protein
VHGTHGSKFWQVLELASSRGSEAYSSIATVVSGVIIDALTELRMGEPSGVPKIVSTHAPDPR